MDKLAVHLESQPRPKLLADVCAERLPLGEVVRRQTVVALSQTGDKVVRAPASCAAHGSNRLIRQRVVAVELFLIVVAFHSSRIKRGRVHSGVSEPGSSDLRS